MSQSAGLNVLCVDVKELLRLAAVERESQEPQAPKQASQKPGYMIRGDPRYTSYLLPPISPADPTVLEEVLRNPQPTLDAAAAAASTTSSVMKSKSATSAPRKHANTSSTSQTTGNKGGEEAEAEAQSAFRFTSTYQQQQKLKEERFAMSPPTPPAHLATKRKPLTDPERQCRPGEDDVHPMSYVEFVVSRYGAPAGEELDSSSQRGSRVPSGPLWRRGGSAGGGLSPLSAARANANAHGFLSPVAASVLDNVLHRIQSSRDLLVSSKMAASVTGDSRRARAEKVQSGKARDDRREDNEPDWEDTLSSPSSEWVSRNGEADDEAGGCAPWSSAAMKETFQSRQVSAARSTALRPSSGPKPPGEGGDKEPTSPPSVPGTPRGMPSSSARWVVPRSRRELQTTHKQQVHLLHSTLHDRVRINETTYAFSHQRQRAHNLRSCPAAMRQLSSTLKDREGCGGMPGGGEISRRQHAERIRRVAAAELEEYPPVVPGPFKRNVLNPPTRRPKLR